MMPKDRAETVLRERSVGWKLEPTTKVLVKGKTPERKLPPHKCDLPLANKARGYAPRDMLGELRECNCGKFWWVVSRRGHHFWARVSPRKARKIERLANGRSEELQSPTLG